MGRRGRGGQPLLWMALLSAIILGGCVTHGEPPEDPAPHLNADGQTTSPGGTLPVAPAGGNGEPATNGSGPPAGMNGTGSEGGDGNTTTRAYADDPWAGEEDPEWPSMAHAKVRPGVQVLVANAQCTTNFLFRDVYTGALYLGTAAHCVEGGKLGQSVTIRDRDGQQAMLGTIAYSSWWSIGFKPQSTGVGDDVHPHDFALIRIPDEKRHLVHPAVLHFGGPTAVADWGLIGLADRVIAYGNSGMRPLIHEQEGYILGKRSEQTAQGPGHGVLIHAVAPPLPGDSGGGLMTKSGAAIGALSAVYAGTPYGAWWEYSSLPHALEHLADSGWTLRLATAPLETDGVLP
jgi:hypothetical protein